MPHIKSRKSIIDINSWYICKSVSFTWIVYFVIKYTVAASGGSIRYQLYTRQKQCGPTLDIQIPWPSIAQAGDIKYAQCACPSDTSRMRWRNPIAMKSSRRVEFLMTADSISLATKREWSYSGRLAYCSDQRGCLASI